MSSPFPKRPPPLPPTAIPLPENYDSNSRLPIVLGIVAGLTLLFLSVFLLVILSLQRLTSAEGPQTADSSRGSGGKFAVEQPESFGPNSAESDSVPAPTLADRPASDAPVPSGDEDPAHRRSSNVAKRPTPRPDMISVRPVAAGPAIEPVDEVADDVGAGSEFTGSDSSTSAGEFFKGALAGRSHAKKLRLLKKHGGTKQTDKAVQLGLEWLARKQQPDGNWSFRGPFSDGYAMDFGGAATAMAMLAFQGDGNTHRAGKYKKVVADGWRALAKLQTPSGDFNWTNGYDHALASIAICELYGMSRDRELRPAAQSAIDCIVESQDVRLGGWRYAPRTDSDTSVTGWFVMALQSGKMAELNVPRSTLEAATRYLDSAAVNDGSQYAYTPRGSGSLSMTAEGLLCRQYLGWKRDDARMQSGANILGANTIDFARPNVYYWYYATQVMHHLGGAPWDKWNTVVRTELPKQQVRGGPEVGSWSCHGPHNAGRLYTTCMCIYMLEVYYRHMPIYSKMH